MEQWRSVPGFEDLYEVSDLGNVRRVGWTTINKGQTFLLRLESTPLGYKRVRLSKDGRPYRFQVHRLVMAAFVGDSPLSVNHKNGNPRDNCLANLEYLAMADNLKDSWVRSPRIGLNQGAKHGMHKLLEADVVNIRLRRSKGEPIAELAASFGVSSGSISMLANRKTWRHVQ